MKAIVCEMCNSNDVVKNDGLYVCQNCGTKYSAEEAKKLMIDISGSTVKIDETDTVANYRKLATEAKTSGNIQKAAEYYNKLVVLCPDDWESVFFSTYFTSANCVIGQIATAAINVSGAIKLAYEKIADYSDEEKLKISEEMSKYVLLLKKGFRETALRQYTEHISLESAKNDYSNRVNAIYTMARTMAEVNVLCGNKRGAIEIYEDVATWIDIDKKSVAKILEALETGRGVKVLSHCLSAANNQLKYTKQGVISGTVVFGAFLLACVIWLVCSTERIYPLVALAVVGIGAFIGMRDSLKPYREARKDVEEWEREIENLKK